jgi:hypothetical protein
MQSFHLQIIKIVDNIGFKSIIVYVEYSNTAIQFKTQRIISLILRNFGVRQRVRAVTQQQQQQQQQQRRRRRPLLLGNLAPTKLTH